MKRFVFLSALMLALFACNAQAKRVIRYPLFESSQTPAFKIDSICLDDKETLVYFHYYNEDGNEWINLSVDAYIKDCKDGKKYKVLSLDNLAKAPEKTYILNKKEWNGVIHFPHIDSNTIDYIESENSTAFNIYGINLTQDGESIDKVNFTELNRKINMADFYFTAKNYEKYIELATPCLKPMRALLGTNGTIDILQKLIDSHILTKNKNSDYENYITEFRKLCQSKGWPNNLNCSLNMDLELLNISTKAFKLIEDNNLEEACILTEEYINKAELVCDINDTIIAFREGICSTMYKQLGNTEKAIFWGQKAIDNYKRLDNTGGLYQTHLSNMAFLYEDIDNTNMSNQCYSELYSLQERLGNKYTFKHAQTGYLWGCMLSHVNNHKESIRVLTDAFQLYESHNMKIDSLLLDIAIVLSQEFLEIKEVSSSINVYEQVINNISNQLGRNNTLFFKAMVEYAFTCNISGEKGKATEIIYEVNKELNKYHFSVEHVKTLMTYAKCLGDIGDSSQAIKVYQIARGIFEQHNLTHKSDYADLLYYLANEYADIQDTVNCISLCKELINGTYASSSIKLYAKNLLAHLYLVSNPAYSAQLTAEVIMFNDNSEKFINDPKELAINNMKLLYASNPDNATVKLLYNDLYNNNLISHFDQEWDAMVDFMRYYKMVLDGKLTDNTSIQNNKKLIKTDILQNILNKFRDYLLLNFMFLTEEQRELYYNDAIKRCGLNSLELAVVSENAEIEELNCLLYDYLLLTKSILLESYNGLNDVIYKSTDKDLIELYERVKKHSTDYDETTIETYEHEIIQKARSLSDFTNHLKTSWKDVRNKLNDNEVALEFFVNKLESHNSYGVLVLRNNWDYPKYINLYLTEVAIEEYGFENMANIWILLLNKGYIKKGDTVFMSGAGVFQSKPFEYLEVNSENNVLFSDICNVVRVTSTREIVKQRSNITSAIKSIILFGGLDYNCNEKYIINKKKDTTQLFRGEGDDRYRSGFENLMYSEEEINTIQSIANNEGFSSVAFRGKEGTEQQVRDLSGEKIGALHFATHGLYYPMAHPDTNIDNPYKQLFNNNDCLNRSFLVMAGGNALPQHKNVKNSSVDGLLTAKEISMIDLHNVNLVVLSACQSAKGDISNEGVLGLQYGFKKAGVNSILMCLDNVDDKATQLFMEYFYQHLLSGHSKQDSIRYAQLCMRKNPIEKYRAREYWENFILLDAID